MPARPWHGLSLPLRVPVASAALAITYFVVASIATANFGTNTPIWFANALAVACLLPADRRTWPLSLALIWVGDSLAIGIFGGPPAPAVALADVFEISVSLFLIRRIGGAVAVLSSVAGMARFIVICLAVPTVSASYGAAIFSWEEGIAYLPQFIQWYSASALGLLVVCPMLLIWTTPEIRPHPSRSELLSSAFLTLGLAAISVIVFRSHNPSYLFVIYPLLLLLVWNRGLGGASVGSAVVLVVGLWDTLAGGGAIAALDHPATDMASHIRSLQIFLGALTLSSLPLAVVLTDLRRLSLELTRVAEARSEFLAAMSHEIRTPMTGVLGMVDLLDTENPTPRQHQQLTSIRSSGRHLLSILNDILDFSRIETGRIELEQVDFSLPVLLEQIQLELAPLARERGIAIDVGLTDRSPPIVRGDPTRLKQILLNLAGNAIKFTPEGSVLILAAYCPAVGARFRFEIRDTGIGIAPDQQLHIFSAFTQADYSTSRRYGGSGLGLAISKRLVDAMGGEIGVESRLGEGSLFWFEIPLAIGDVANLCQEGLADTPTLAPRRVLLAEDVELNRDIIRTILERDGHLVAIAENGRQAVKRVRQERYDLILMDVHMPVMDGLDATRAIRALPGPAAATPIIALTANVMAAEQEKCRQAGMDDVLMKPIDWEQVRAAIRKHGGYFHAPDAPVATGGGEPADLVRFDEAAFAELAAIIPRDQLALHVSALEAEVSLLSTAEPDHDRDALRNAAHRIVSQAGMLGLTRLSCCASGIEEACLAGHAVEEALCGLRAASADVRDCLVPHLKATKIATAR